MNKIKQSKSTALFASILLLISSIVFTIAVAFLDVKVNPVGGHNIGLSAINLAFNKSFPYNELLHMPVIFLCFLQLSLPAWVPAKL